MNAITTISQSLLASPWSSPFIAGSLSGLIGAHASIMSEVVYVCCTQKPITKATPLLIGNALIGTLPALFYKNYWGALISIPCSFATLFATAGLIKPKNRYGHLAKPALLATAFVAVMSKFLLQNSLLNSFMLSMIFKSVLDIILTIYMLIDGFRPTL